MTQIYAQNKHNSIGQERYFFIYQNFSILLFKIWVHKSIFITITGQHAPLETNMPDWRPTCQMEDEHTWLVTGIPGQRPTID